MTTAADTLDVLGLGNSCLDTWIELERWPAAGDAVGVRAHRQLSGGQVASALVGCRRLGLRTGYLLRTGADAAGRQQRACLAAEGIDLRWSRVVADAPSATAFILHDPGEERTVIWHTDERLHVQAGELTPAMFAGVRALLTDGRDEGAPQAARLARAAGAAVVADCDCFYGHTGELLPLIDHLIVPEAWARTACPEAGSLAAAMAALAAQGPKTVVATRGAAGAEAFHAGAWWHTPAIAVPVLDTTGAGDAFHAGYLYGLLQRWELAQRLRFASAAAALACTAIGAQAGLTGLAAVEDLLARAPASA